MCLRVVLEKSDFNKDLSEIKEDKYIKTLKEDKIVYKLILKLADLDIYVPIFQYLFDKSFTYKFSKRYHIDKLGIYRPYEHIVDINEGFHAYTNLELAKSGKDSLSPFNMSKNSIILVECIFPKGSRYCEGWKEKYGGKECVSDTIIINKIVSK